MGMRSKRPRLNLLSFLRLRMERPVPVLSICCLTLLLGWCTVARWDVKMAGCLAAYERASTAADSARVDLTPLSARGRSTCSNLRRDGTLDRYRRSIEEGRVARRG
jgi:hypothetical protein